MGLRPEAPAELHRPLRGWPDMNLAIPAPYIVIPAQAGIQGPRAVTAALDPAFAGVTCTC
jgi:hypothetical protein